MKNEENKIVGQKLLRKKSVVSSKAKLNGHLICLATYSLDFIKKNTKQLPFI
ncbi:MAG: hypothetical protein AB8G15_01230 [Saprospiraceae bacterium]